MPTMSSFARAGVIFEDLNGHWAENEIMLLYNQNIFRGTGDGQMDPDGLYTYAHAIALLTRSLDIEVADSEPWYESYYHSALKSGWVGQLTDEQLNAPILRGEMVEMMFLASPHGKYGESLFEESLMWSVKNDILKGRGNGYQLDEKLTRAEGGVFVYRFTEYLHKTEKINNDHDGDVQIIVRALNDHSSEVTLSWGEKPTGGYSIKIKEVVIEGDRVKIYYTTTSPGPDDIVTQAFTYPKDKVLVQHPHLTKDDIELIKVH